MPTIPANLEERADSIQSLYRASVRQIKDDGDLTPEARQRRLAKVYVDARREMDAVQEQWAGGTKNTVAELNREMFGAASNGADAAGARDARDRVLELRDGQHALAVLVEAEEVGDNELATAIARRAFKERDTFWGNDWNAVLDTYVENRPGVASKIEELAAAGTSSLQSDMHNAGKFYLVLPTEIQNLSPTGLNKAAEESA